VKYALLTEAMPPDEELLAALSSPPEADTGLPWQLGSALLAILLTLATWFGVGCAHAAPAPLFEQLGGVAGIERLTTRLLDRTAGDPRTGASFKGVNRRELDRSVAAYLCRLADGPCVYEGETMRNSHADLGIRGSQFDLMVQFLRDELDAAGVSTAAKNELLRRLAPTRRDIVQP